MPLKSECGVRKDRHHDSLSYGVGRIALEPIVAVEPDRRLAIDRSGCVGGVTTGSSGVGDVHTPTAPVVPLRHGRAVGQGQVVGSQPQLQR